jgi:hypothetical protein
MKYAVEIGSDTLIYIKTGSGIQKLMSGVNRHKKGKENAISGYHSNNLPRVNMLQSRWLPTTAARVRTLSGHVEFVMDQVALGQIFLRVLRFPLPIIIPPNSPSS